MVLITAAMKAFTQDSIWFTDHYEKFKSSGTKVIAIKDRAILLEGENMEDVLQELEKLGHDAALTLIEVIPSDDTAFIL